MYSRLTIFLLFLGFSSAEFSRPALAIQNLATSDSAKPDDEELLRRKLAHFEKSVRPLLVEHCLDCHGDQKQESGLRVDRSQYLLQGGDSGPAILPGLPDKSLLIKAIEHSDELAMPPEKKLSPREIEAIRIWIREGAHWPVEAKATSSKSWKQHWSFQKIRNPSPPELNDSKVSGSRFRVANEIDRFILKRINQSGLDQSPKANPDELVRRAYFDLHGIGPTFEQANKFMEDQRPDRFPILVRQLLDSSRYGEMQARKWMDVARYADNKGYVFFEDKNYPWAYTYRDWLIRSFNNDLPFDQFILQQLAADFLVTDKDSSNLPALGFLTVGAKFVNNVHDQVDDRIDVVTRGLMGLTVSCARCHDHKFDPIPQADYYSLYGVFRSCYEPVVLPTFKPLPQSAEFRKYQEGLKTRLDRLNQFIEKQRASIMQGARERISEYLMAVHARRNHPTTENFMTLTDKGAIIPKVILRYEVYLKRLKKMGDPIWAPWNHLAEISDKEFSSVAPARLKALLNNKEIQLNPLVRSALSPLQPTSMQQVADAYGKLFKEVSSFSEKKHQPLSPAQEDLVEVLHGKDSPAELPPILGWGFLDLIPDRPTQGEYQKLIKQVEDFAKSGPQAPPRAMVTLDSATPFEPHVFLRGNPNRKGDQVPRRFLTSLPNTKSLRAPFPKNQSGRLQLAQAIASPENPLTARVIVNRIWKQHFGKGLVSTPSDFGIQGTKPSHPELLDWLASWFIRNGWSIKKLHELIMCSETYQQSSRVRALAHNKDPANALLSRGHSRRLEFESMRDSLIHATGMMDDQIGGKSFDLFAGFSRRRTIYGFINRMDLPGVLRTFDYPEPAATSAQREKTTVPAQALFFLNHPMVSQSAKKILARESVQKVQGRKAKVTAIYRALFARDPNDSELNLAIQFLGNPRESTPQAWRYGYGKLHEKKELVLTFHELPHFTGTHWQGGAKLPDPKLNWLYHAKDESHPGASKELCSIRRWVAPRDGVVKITGMLEHEPKQGNGVLCQIVSSRKGGLGTWKVHHSKTNTRVESIKVHKHDTLDFISSFHGDIAYDQHKWSIRIELTPIRDSQAPLAATKEKLAWESVKDFAGPQPSRWQTFVHALLMTNEFMFVD